MTKRVCVHVIGHESILVEISYDSTKFIFRRTSFDQSHSSHTK